MKVFTLGKRVSAGFAAVIAVTLALGVVTFDRFLISSSASEYLATDPIPGTVSIVEIDSTFRENFALVEMYLSGSNVEKLAPKIQENKKRIDELITKYQGTITEERDREMFATFQRAREAFVVEYTATLALYAQGKKAEAIAAGESRLLPAYEKVDVALDQLVQFNQANLDRGVARIRDASSAGKALSLIGVAVAVLAAAVIAYFIVRSTTKVLTQLATTIDAGSNQIVSAAGQVSSASQSLAEGATEQAASLEETSASLEEMSSMTQRNAENAQQAKTTAGNARSCADDGGEKMQAMQNAMNAIHAASAEISKILKTIDEIAFQTNILALNAAVEAARAGEAGAGFAVVADEVRALAQRCANAARETGGKIEDAVAKSRQGATLSAEVAKSFEAIQKQIHELDAIVGEIATASAEQNRGIGQVTKAVSQMDQVTQANAGNAEENAAAAEELNAQSNILRDSVATLLALAGSTVDAKRDHFEPAHAPAPKAKPQPQPRKTEAKAPAKAPRLITTHPVPVTRTANGSNGHAVVAAVNGTHEEHSDFFRNC